MKTDEFKVTGECVDNGSGDFEAETFLAARKNNLAYSAYGPEAGVDPFDVDFDKSDPPVNFTGGDASGVDPAIEAAEYYEFYAEGKGVPPLRGRVETTVHASADCGFSGIFTGMPGNGPLNTSKRIEVGLGETERIYSNKDFKVLGFCEDEGSGSFRADTFLEAKRGGTIYYLTEYDQFDTDFGPNDGQVDITPDFYDASGTDPSFALTASTTSSSPSARRATCSRRGSAWECTSTGRAAPSPGSSPGLIAALDSASRIS